MYLIIKFIVFILFLERYHSLDTKMKTNPLSLEEVRLIHLID